ncbi:transposase [Streptomyces sp. NPDC048419]|uniref:transposase n=1 Tax=Streptomyces sp. NPDC048419 TaxID=3365547 RepID=UPI003719A532
MSTPISFSVTPLASRAAPACASTTRGVRHGGVERRPRRRHRRRGRGDRHREGVRDGLPAHPARHHRGPSRSEGRFPTPEHLVSWAKLCPRTIQSGAKNSTGPAGQGNPWLKGALGEAANAAARTDTFLGARYRRIVKRRGHAKAVVAVARSILVIAWHLIDDPDASYQELGADWHRRHLDPARKTRDLVRQLQALGHQVALTPASA